MPKGSRSGFPSPEIAASCLAIALLALLVPAAASAQFETGVSGGGFFPSDGNGGPSIQVRFGGGPSKSFRIAGELEYRKFESELFGLDDVEIDSIGLRLLLSYIFLPDAALSPYVGAGLGLGLNFIDDEAIEAFLIATNPGVVDADVSPAGLSLGVLGLLGLQVPLGDHIRLFGEGRYGGDWQVTGEQKTTSLGTTETTKIDAENLGGFSAIAGIRVVF